MRAAKEVHGPAPSAGGHMKRMIGIVQQLCPRAELLDERLYQLGVRERITSSLQEQHRNFHIKKVISALVRRSPSRVKREPEKHQAPNSRQR
jgi:hypothetical protein